MKYWINLSKQRKVEILNQTLSITGLPDFAIEKDWWVTVVMKAVFSLPYAENIVFKGGTSLSKAWNLIERFSEDIDLALDRKFLGFDGDLSKGQVKQLRWASCDFMTNKFINDLNNSILEIGISQKHFSLKIQPTDSTGKDPQVIELHYNSVTDIQTYLPNKVLIEIGARSLMEPVSSREINSLISQTFPDQSFSNDPFFVLTVEPKRTFLEKALLLHEEFSKPIEKIRVERLSRHLYDLEKLMDTEHGIKAINDNKLFDDIVTHRKKYNPITGIDYKNHTYKNIDFIPPASAYEGFSIDYKAMKNNMIYGESLEFEKLISRLIELKERFRNKS